VNTGTRTLVSLLIIPTILIMVMGTSASAGERLSVRSGPANVRSGPDTKQPVLWQVEKYYPVIVLQKKGNWIRFQDFEGDQGWIYASLLDRTQTIVIKVDHCNIRKGPGSRFEVAFTVDRGIPFKVLQTKGKWLEIQHADGDRGWVYSELVW
jgi:SH3-like domain-containing protein